MKYDFKCDSCKSVETFDMDLTTFEESKAGIPCSCGKTRVFKFDVKSVDFVFTGDSWSDKNYKEKAYRKDRSSYMASRQAQNSHAAKLMPNYNGEETNTWTEARDAARDAGKSTASYEPLIHKETRSK